MKFVRFFTFVLVIIVGGSPLSFACHRDDCPHSTTDTGIHWNRSLRFSFGDKEFNLLKSHQTMSRRAEEVETDEGIDYLNIALGNIQVVYEDGDSFKTSPPFEIRALDAEDHNNPFFSNLGIGQTTHHSFVKFSKIKLNEGRHKTAKELIHSLKKIPLDDYSNEENKLIEKRNEIVIKIEELSNPKKRKRKREEEKKKIVYNDFSKNIIENKVKTAKKVLEQITKDFPLEGETLEDIKAYFQEYKELKRKIKEGIEIYIKDHRNQIMANILFGLEEWTQKSKDLEKPHSPGNYIRLIENVIVACEQKLEEEEEDLNTNPVSFAWRRLQALKTDFTDNTNLPFNRDRMFMDLKTTETSHLQHSEQLLIYHLNTNFTDIEKEFEQFLTNKRIGRAKIHGAFFNLFSTRDMCERCAVCLTIDHAHKNGLGAKITNFIQKHNKEPECAPFVVYAVSSRVPYSTPMGVDRINSRDGVKSVDSYSNYEKGRNVISLSKAHISIQSYFFSHMSAKEITEDDINSINESYVEIIDMIE